MAIEDIFGGAMSGVGPGASIGSMIGGPGLGTGLGALAGGVLGGGLGFFRGKARDKSKQALGQARMQLEQLARDQRTQRMADLNQAMSFFQPAQEQYRKLYGGTPGQGGML